MNKNAVEKIIAVLSEQSFFEENKDLATPEAITAAILEKVPEATAEDVDMVMTHVSNQLQQGELTEDNLDNVAGGALGALAAWFTVDLVLKCVGAAAATGTVIGGACWYWKHRKCSPN